MRFVWTRLRQLLWTRTRQGTPVVPYASEQGTSYVRISQHAHGPTSKTSSVARSDVVELQLPDWRPCPTNLCSTRHTRCNRWKFISPTRTLYRHVFSLCLHPLSIGIVWGPCTSAAITPTHNIQINKRTSPKTYNPYSSAIWRPTTSSYLLG